MVLIRFSIFSFRHHHHAVDGGDYPSRVRRGISWTGASRWTLEAPAGDRLPITDHRSISRPPGATRTSGNFPQWPPFVHRNRPLMHLHGGHVTFWHGTARPSANRACRQSWRVEGKIGGRSVGVDHFPHGGKLAPQFLVLLRLAVDLVAGVQHRRMVAAAQLLADAQQ